MTARVEQPAKDRSVLFVATGLGNGGAERQLVYLAVGLKKRGWRVEILTLLDPVADNLVHELRSAGILLESVGGTTEINPRNLVGSTAQIVRKLRQARPAVMVGWLVHAILLTRLAGLIVSRRNVVSSLRGMRSNAVWQDRLLGLTDRLSRVVVTNSHASARIHLAEGVTRPGKLVVIHNGLDFTHVEAGAEDLAAGRETTDTPFVWLAVGRMDSEKDYPTMLRAARLLPGGPDRWELWIAGGGRNRETTESLARDLGLQDRVRFLGHRKDVPTLMKQVDGVVLSSVMEGLPNALMEAHLAGLPVVATDVGGVREVVLNGISGVVVPSQDPVRFSQAMQAVMDLPERERLAWGTQGRRHVTESFGMQHMVDRWEAVLLGQHPPQRQSQGEVS